MVDRVPLFCRGGSVAMVSCVADCRRGASIAVIGVALVGVISGE